MLKKIGGIITLIIFIVLIAAAFRPNSFQVTRSIIIQGPPEKVFPYVNNLHQWQKWSPFEKLDPNMKKAFEGPPEGQGSSSSWSGNMQAGEGKTTIVQSQPNEFIGIDLEMVKPIHAKHAVQFIFKPEGNGTLVIWTMVGAESYFSKLIHMFMSVDKMIGPHFEEGLKQLKSVVEANK